MHARRRTFFDFHGVIRSLEDLSERQQMTALKLELFHALERESECRARGSKLEQSLVELRAESDREHDAFAVRCHAELTDARREIEHVRSDCQKSLAATRLELLAARLRCHDLEELCRSLLSIIEQAAESVAESDAALAEASGELA